MSARHVVPAEDGWQVKKDHAQRPSARTPTQAEAITRALEIVANDGGGEVVIHGTDGQVRETRTVEPGAQTTPAEATKATAAAAEAGIKSTAKSAIDEASTAASAISDDATSTGKKISGESATTARKVADTADAAASGIAERGRSTAEDVNSAVGAGREAASIAGSAGREIGSQVNNSARQMAGDARAATDRGLNVVEDTAGHAGQAVRGGADRAATIGGQLENELDTTADRTARKVRTLTERAAQPLDHTTEQLLDTLARLTRALNPVRVTGRVVEVGASATLRTAGALTSRGGRATQSSARALTGPR
jgi:hypothetical protein